MPAYTTKAKVEELLPSALPAAITDADFTQWIDDASSEVDDEVGTAFPLLDSGQKFVDAPNTPRAIEQCARWLAGANAFTKLKVVNRTQGGLTQGDRYRQMAEAKLGRIRRGEIDVYGTDGEDLATESAATLVVSTRMQQFTETELDKF